MFEKIKAWIKRKRETAREQQAADRLIKHIEQALGFELYECHNKEHHKQERHKRYRFDENGGILPPYQKNN